MTLLKTNLPLPFHRHNTVAGPGGGGGQGGHPDPPKKHFRPSGPQFGLKIRGGGPLGPFPGSASAIAFILCARDTEAARERRINTRKEAAPKFRVNFAACYRGYKNTDRAKRC